MSAPQWVMVGLYALSLIVNLAKHGEQRTGKYDIGEAVIGVLLSAVVLAWGGFWQ